ncbi:MAG: hypothetical protein EZS28_023740, partial [Streblomastix strix]
MIGQGGE